MGAALRYPEIHCVPFPKKSAPSFAVRALLVGTGGESTAGYYRLRGLKGYAYSGEPVPVVPLPPERTPAEDLAHIRAVLKPTVTDLALAFGVSRQAVYDWQNGRPIAAENAARLADLARAADVFAAEGLTATAQVLRRPVAAGRTLYGIVREGGSAEDAAGKLCGILRREARQREALSARLANRGRPVVSADDYGLPMLDELG